MFKPIQEYRWMLPDDATPQTMENSGIIKKLIDELHISSTIAQLLVNRGIDTYEKARAFFVPNFKTFTIPS